MLKAAVNRYGDKITEVSKTSSLRRGLTGVLLILLTPSLHAQTAAYRTTRTLRSPRGDVAAVVAASDTQYGPIFCLGSIVKGSFQPFVDLPNPVYRREYHGSDWFQTMPERWISDRFLVFEDKFGLAIADVQNRRMLVNHVFTAYEKSPVADRWAAIRFRPMARDQELLGDDFQDTILLIAPYDVANLISQATEENFVGQMKSVNPGGIVLAKPEWSPDGSTFAVLTWKSGKVEAVQYETNLKETGRITVDLYVAREVALSPALNTELEQTAEKILSDPTIFQLIPPTPAP